MIFFGSRGKIVSGQIIEGIQCPSCESKQFVTFGILRYFHLYWIPTLIISKKVGIECTHCKKTLVGEELPEDLSKKIKTTVFNKKNTFPMFSGLMIIALLALSITFYAYQSNINDNSYVEQPAANDLYIVNLTKIFSGINPKYKYGIMRVKNIQDGQAELQMSNVAYSKTSGARKDIREKQTSADSYYSSKHLYIKIDHLKEMKESGAIYSIDRN